MNLANTHLQETGFYKPPLAGRRDFPGLLLDFNERTIPCSLKVQAALSAFLAEGKFRVYPEYARIEAKIADYAGVKAEQVAITNGSDQGIELVFRTFTEKGDKVIIPAPSFAMFFQCASAIGNEIVKPLYRWETGMAYPTEDVLAAIDEQVRLIVVCSPNNPTGTLISPADLEAILVAAPEAIVLVDEAYFEYCGQSAVGLIERFSNLVITRTFSKVFGLAALRIGYLMAQESTLTEMLKVRGPYDVNMAAVLAAEAALDDIDDMKAYVEEVMTRAKPMVEAFLEEVKIPFVRSDSNFILLKPSDAESFYSSLEKAGIRTRPQKNNGIDGTVRVTIGTQSQMEKFIMACRQSMPMKVAFLDRDGALIEEPATDYQVDSLEKLRILDGVLDTLKALQNRGYTLVMVTNQDGLGTSAFPRETFEAPQKKMLEIFAENGIRFAEIFICPHFPADGCLCRKPQLGMLRHFLETTNIDLENSFMFGDRESDREFAKNLGVPY